MNPDKSREWADNIVDGDEETGEYEPTYRDGSAQNECWAGEGYTRPEQKDGRESAE